MPGSRFSLTIKRVSLTALLAFCAGTGFALAQSSAPPPQPQSACNPNLNPAIPLAQRLTPQGIFPSQPAQFGNLNLDACGDAARYAPATQPFSAGYPYPAAWWSFGVHAPIPYRGP